MLGPRSKGSAITLSAGPRRLRRAAAFEAQPGLLVSCGPAGQNQTQVRTSARTPPRGVTVTRVRPNASTAPIDRVAERRRAVALARHFREAEGISIAQIADRLGRSPAEERDD